MTKPKYNKPKSKKPFGRKPKTNKGSNADYQSQPNEGANSNNRSSVHVSGNINDPSYYFSNAEFMKQVTNISFNDFMGISDTLYGAPEPYTYGVPYFMRINLNASPGFTTADDEGSLGNALNLAALELYTTLSANNGRTASYAPQDIATLMLAIGDIISMAGYITRVFGTAYLFNQRNRAYPKELIEAQGVDYDDLMANFANYRARFNAMLTAQSEIPFPANIPYFTKCAELYSGLYVDDPNTQMAAIYAFVPNSVWILDDTASEQGTMLGSVRLWAQNEKGTMSGLLTIFDQMLAAINTSASVTNNIYADILRLADKGTISTYKFAIVPDDYRVFPTFVPEVAMWINNLRVMGEPLQEPAEGYTVGNNVYHNAETNRLNYRPQFHWTGSDVHLVNPTMNFSAEGVTPADIVSATRLMAYARGTVEGTGAERAVTTTICALPDHYVASIYLYTPAAFATITQPAISGWDALIMGLLSNFKYAPIMYTFAGDSGNMFSIFGDITFYTQVDFDYLSRLHDTSYLGLFEIR